MASRNEGDTSALVLLSGGIDSTACIHFLKNQNFQVSAFHIQYGQPASLIEKVRSEEIAQYFNVPLRMCQVHAATHLTDGEIQGRNAFLIFNALALAEQTHGIIAIGVHAGTNYYDCSVPFLKKISTLVAESTDGRVSLLAPFIEWTKADIFKYSQQHKLPINLTYSCERGTTPPCGTCLSCKDRKGLECY
jgi:7-cyano-7-deazaguanine synthase